MTVAQAQRIISYAKKGHSIETIQYLTRLPIEEIQKVLKEVK